MTLSDEDRIRKYAFSDIVVQRFGLCHGISVRYCFIKDIKDCCEKGEFKHVKDKIVPILGDLVADRDSCIRCVVLNQFEYIAKVFVVLGLNFSYSLIIRITKALT